jgi:NAD(P)-dependent dehydrogenase (short-subunit alcohol dehydrogenase family)
VSRRRHGADADGVPASAARAAAYSPRRRSASRAKARSSASTDASAAHGSGDGLDLLPAGEFEDCVGDLLEDIDSPYLPLEAAGTLADVFCGGGGVGDGAAFAAAVAKEFGRLDVLVNNAGMQP